MNKLFGTDGVRGIAGAELTCELAMNIGKALASIIEKEGNSKKVLIGKDTRISCDMLEGALVSGLCSLGVDVVLLGVVPTPAVAYLVLKYGADAGIMISASHNSFEFNGIKIFNSKGYKLPDDIENSIETMVLSGKNLGYKIAKDIGRVFFAETAVDDYIEHIKGTISSDLKGLKVVIDCANGSASRTAKRLFTELGAKCKILFDEPNGFNINDGCGSVNMQFISKYVKEQKFDVGIAFDGDADRCLAVDENGNILDGDNIMAICLEDLRSKGKLSKTSVVGTVMTNMGFNVFCSDMKVNFISSNVGDRYVLENMIEHGYNFGGEQSGHIIFLDFATTGDGQLTAVQLLSAINERRLKLSIASTVIEKYPQVMVNVEVKNDKKQNLAVDDVINKKIEEVKEKLQEAGRVLVRASGTEPLVRIMLEGKDIEKIETFAKEIADLIRERLC